MSRLKMISTKSLELDVHCTCTCKIQTERRSHVTVVLELQHVYALFMFDRSLYDGKRVDIWLLDSFEIKPTV